MPRNEPQSCYHFLTVNNPTVEPEKLVETLKDPQYSVKCFAFQLEEGEEKHTPHFQMVIGYLRSQRMSYTNKIPGLEKASVTPSRDAYDSWHYCTTEDKKGTRLAGPWTWGPVPKKKGDTINHWAMARQQPNRTQALNYLITNLPRDMMLHGDRIDTNLRYFYRPPTTTVRHVTFNLEKMDLSKVNILYGGSGLGKTSYALSHFTNPLLIRHIDSLRQTFDPTLHDGLVFDEICTNRWPIPSIITLFDMDFDATVHCRYGIATIPAGFPRIFTINELSDLIPPNLSTSQHDAIYRRVVTRLIENKLFD